MLLHSAIGIPAIRFLPAWFSGRLCTRSQLKSRGLLANGQGDWTGVVAWVLPGMETVLILSVSSLVQAGYMPSYKHYAIK
jgi:hypothetical protein